MFHHEILTSNLCLVTYYLAIAGYLRLKTIKLNFSETEAVEIEERKTLLADKDLEKLKSKLHNLMNNEKLYLEPKEFQSEKIKICLLQK